MSILVGSWVAPETQTQSTQDLTQKHKIFLGLKSGFMYSVYSEKKGNNNKEKKMKLKGAKGFPLKYTSHRQIFVF